MAVPFAFSLDFSRNTVYHVDMATKILKRIKKLEQEIGELKKPKSILGTMHVNDSVMQQASKALFDFDIESFISLGDLKKPWK